MVHASRLAPSSPGAGFVIGKATVTAGSVASVYLRTREPEAEGSTAARNETSQSCPGDDDDDHEELDEED